MFNVKIKVKDASNGSSLSWPRRRRNSQGGSSSSPNLGYHRRSQTNGGGGSIRSMNGGGGGLLRNTDHKRKSLRNDKRVRIVTDNQSSYQSEDEIPQSPQWLNQSQSTRRRGKH